MNALLQPWTLSFDSLPLLISSFVPYIFVRPEDIKIEFSMKTFWVPGRITERLCLADRIDRAGSFATRMIDILLRILPFLISPADSRIPQCLAVCTSSLAQMCNATIALSRNFAELAPQRQGDDSRMAWGASGRFALSVPRDHLQPELVFATRVLVANKRRSLTRLWMLLLSLSLRIPSTMSTKKRTWCK